MEKIVKYFLAILMIMVAAVACRDEDLERRPSMSDNIGAITMITQNPDRTFFNAFNALEDEYVEFTIDVDGFDVTEVTSVELELVFTEKDRVYDPFRDEFVDSVYAPIVIKTVNSFPATVQITGQEIIDALGFTSAADFEVGDQFNVTFPINTADGRRLTVALNSELCNQPGQPSFGGCNVAWVVTCPSTIPAGTYTASTDASSTDTCPAQPTLTDFAATVELTVVSPGVYRISDFFAGAYKEWYGACYGYTFNTGRNFTDVCNNLSFSFNDGFNAGVTGTGTYDPGTGVITYTWTNVFGDTGTTTLTPQ